MFDERVLFGDQLIVNRLQGEKALLDCLAGGDPLLPLRYLILAPLQRFAQLLLQLLRLV